MADRTLEKQRDGRAADLREQLASAEASIRRLVERLDKLWLELRAAEDRQRTAEAAAISAERKLSQRYQELAALAKFLRQQAEENEIAEAKLKALSDQLETEQEEKSALLDEIAQLTQKVGELSKRVIDQEQEKTTILERRAQLSEKVSTLSRRLQDQEESFSEHLGWSANILESTFDQPPWWGILPAKSRRRRRHERLNRLGLFDAQAYLDRNPDVAEAGLDPVHHYLVHGFAEGRSR